MSRRREREAAIESETARAHAHDGLDRLSILTTRANLIWLAGRQRDVAAREASNGRALTGMPVHRSTEPRLPGVLSGPDLSGDIARALNELVREVMDAVPDWTPDAVETRRWRQAAEVVERVCETAHDALAWWDTASALRARAERALGPSAAGRFMGWCAVPQCGGEIRMEDGEVAAVCPECRDIVTREQQVAYILEELDGRLMTRSELATALVTVGADVPYSTLCRWIATGVVPEAEEGLYRFHDAFTRAAKRATRIQLGGSAA